MDRYQAVTLKILKTSGGFFWLMVEQTEIASFLLFLVSVTFFIKLFFGLKALPQHARVREQKDFKIAVLCLVSAISIFVFGYLCWHFGLTQWLRDYYGATY